MFLHPFNTNDSTCELDKEWKKVLTPLLKNFNLLVLGYGGNDGSLMDYLNEIDSDNRKAIYWCKRKKDVLNAKIKNLLTEKDFTVSIEGFDELMYALNNALEYTTFNNLDKPDEHPFVLAAKKRIIAIDDKRKKLIELAKDKKEDISEDVKYIMPRVLKYIIDVNKEKSKDKKEDIYKEALEKYPNDAYLLESYASFLFENNDVVKAEEFYQKVIEIKPEFYAAYNNWGNALGNLATTKTEKKSEKLYNQAFIKYQKAIDIKSDFYEAFYNWGTYLGYMAETMTGKEAEKLYIQSFTKFQKAIDIKPYNEIVFYSWGTYLGILAAKKTGIESEELYNQSFTKFQKALEIKPNYHEVIHNWGTNLGNLAAKKIGIESEHLYNQAFTKFQKTIEIKPDYYDTFYNWGTNLWELAKIKERKESKELYIQAIEKFQKGIKLGGKCYNLACLYSTKQDKEKALHYLDISLANKEEKAEFVLKDSEWDFYKEDPQFKELIKKYLSENKI